MNSNRRLNNDILLHVLSLSTDATAVYTGEELLIEMANDAMIAFWGKDKTVVGQTLEQAVPELDGQPFIGLLQEVWRSGISYHGKDTPAVLNVTGSLETFYFDFSYRAIKNDKGEIYCILHTAKDVSDRVHAAEKLKKSRKRQKKIARVLADNEARALSVLDTMAEGVVICDLHDQIIYVNEAARYLLGPEYKSVFWHRFRTDENYLSRDQHPATLATSSREKTVDYVVNIQTDSRKKLYLSVNAAPLLNSKGELTGSVATLTDVTQRRKLNDQLAESEKRFRAMIHQAPVAIMVLRGQDLLIDIANEAMMRLMNSSGAVVGLSLIDVLPEIVDQPVMKQMYEVLQTGRSFYSEEVPVLLMRNGHLVTCYFNVSYSPLYEDGQITGILEVATEVTGLVEAQKVAEQSEEILSQAISSANLGTWTIEFESDRLLLSERSKAIYGLKPSDDLSPEAWLQAVQPDCRDTLSRAVSKIDQTNDRFSLEYLILPMDGGPQKWLRTTGRAMLNRHREMIGISGTMLDITEQKETEQRKDDFISIASHELKTPVTSLKASLQLLDRIKNRPESDIAPKLINQARKSMERVSTLIDDLLNVGRMQKGELPLSKTIFNITRLINDCSNPVSLTGKHPIHVLGEENALVYADEHRIDQVLVNLITNAIKYAPESEIIINVEKQEDWIKVSVADHGPGIPPDKIPHIFERYYRAGLPDNYTSGLGLGLYISHDIIRRHGGEMGVKSDVGKGTVFWFTLPGRPQ